MRSRAYQTVIDALESVAAELRASIEAAQAKVLAGALIRTGREAPRPHVKTRHCRAAGVIFRHTARISEAITHAMA